MTEFTTTVALGVGVLTFLRAIARKVTLAAAVEALLGLAGLGAITSTVAKLSAVVAFHTTATETTNTSGLTRTVADDVSALATVVTLLHASFAAITGEVTGTATVVAVLLTAVSTAGRGTNSSTLVLRAVAGQMTNLATGEALELGTGTAFFGAVAGLLV
eukprot:TRINITY_DN3306_c3_g3_i1.p1 TRINITY_DN3306_c3_g3~~TRINITY_DN3306_c3_g3_i1.p1  ORF type:complete len:160 (+),score=10.51 TRINITY_DN3306_c3_g3_i1:100-579(+)